MSKKIFVNVILTILCVTMTTGCSFSGNENEEENKLPSELNITYVKAPLNVPSIIEKNDELFEKEFKSDDIKINWHELTTGPQQTQALASGEIDICHALGGTSALIAASNGVNLKIIGTYSKSPKGFMIVTNDDSIKSVKDLKGKIVGGPKGTILHQILVSALKSENMTIEDVNFIDMNIPDATSALEGGSIDCALVAGPSALQALNSGKRKVIDGDGLVDGIIVIAVSNDFIEKYPDLIERFIKVHKNTMKYMNEHYEEMISKVAREVDLSQEDTEELFMWYDFNTSIGSDEIRALEETQDFLIDNKLQENKINVEELILKNN